jgi:hypothetical protein
MFLPAEAMMEGLLSVEPAVEVRVQVPFSLLMGIGSDKLELPVSFELRLSSILFRLAHWQDDPASCFFFAEQHPMMVRRLPR